MLVLFCFWQLQSGTIILGSLCSFCLATYRSKVGQLFRAFYVRFILLPPFQSRTIIPGYVRYVLLLTISKWGTCSGLLMFILSCYWQLQTEHLFLVVYVRFVLLLTVLKWDNCSGLFMFVLSCYWPHQSGTIVPGSFMFVLSCYWQFKLEQLFRAVYARFSIATDRSKVG